MAQLPLEGIRVTDFGWILAVPHGTAWLAAMGAEVIKIESMQRPDLVRLLGHLPGKGMDLNASSFFNGLNYGKKGITLNMAHPKAHALAKELVKRSDIVSENFTVGNMKKWGLGYEDLCAIKPDIIMLSGTPLGQFGRESNCVGWATHPGIRGDVSPDWLCWRFPQRPGRHLAGFYDWGGDGLCGDGGPTLSPAHRQRAAHRPGYGRGSDVNDPGGADGLYS